MADTKISALTSASTPLAGTEVLPIVQSGTTVKVPVASLTAGRAVSAASLSLTGSGSSLNQGTSGDATNIARSITNSVSSTVTALTLSAGQYLDNAAAGDVVRIAPTGKNHRFGNSTTGATQVVIGDAGLTVTAQNLIIGTSGKGIDFSATPGTGTSELLNDYEEGTWTPVGNGITYSTAVGTYTKIGRFVYLSFNITFPATANASAATMSGIPFANGTNSAGGGGYRYSTAGQYFTMAVGSTDVTFFDFTGNQPTNASLSTKQIQGFVQYTV